MSSIKTTYGRDGAPRFRVRVKYKGEVRSRTFHTSEADAQAWADQQLEEMKSPEGLEAPKPITIGAMIEWFVSEFPGYDQSVIDGAQVLGNFMADRLSAELVLTTFPDMGQEAVFLEYVVEWGRHNGVFVKQNPFSAARRVFDNLPYRPVASSEMDFLIAKAVANDEHEYLAAFLSLIMDGALKQVEALRIRRHDVDLGAGELKFEGRVIPLSETTLQFVKARMALVDSDDLFSNVTVKQSKSRLSDYCKFLGIDEVKFPDLRREGAYRLCLRYGSARAWAMLGNPSTATSAWMIVAAERNRRIVEVLGPLPDFSL